MKKAKLAAALAFLVIVAYLLVSPGPVSSQTPTTDHDSRNKSGQSASSSVTGNIKDWSQIAQAIATVLAIGLGGLFAWRNSQVFRAKAPHVSISHEVSHRFVGAEFIHISLTVVLHNSSRVNIEFLDGFASLQQISPSSDKTVDELYDKLSNERERQYLQWPTREMFRRSWNKDELIVEPGESETEVFEFIVSKDIKSVLLTSYFYNSRVLGKIDNTHEVTDAPRSRGTIRRWREAKGPRGWSRATVYDIIRHG